MVHVVQWLLLHIHRAKSYGVTPGEEQQGDVQARLVYRILEKLKELDPSPLGLRVPSEMLVPGI